VLVAADEAFVIERSLPAGWNSPVFTES